MRVLGIVCSPRKGGNTEIMVSEALEAARAWGSETSWFHCADHSIKPCEGCMTCNETGVCRIQDDDMPKLYREMESADGIILGTPVYFTTVTAQAKTVMDRTYCYLKVGGLKGKVAAAVVVTRRVGAGSTLSLLYTYFVAMKMVNAGRAVGYGRAKGEVRQGVGHTLPSALEEARIVGQNVVHWINLLAKTK